MITFTDLLKRAKSELITIHTPTKEQAKTLLSELDKKGYTWRTGTKLTDISYYEDDEENTCYSFYDDAGKLLDKKVLYGPLDFYQEVGYTIIEFSESDFKEKNKMKFEDLIKKYYLDKQKEKSERIYCDINKMLEEDRKEKK